MDYLVGKEMMELHKLVYVPMDYPSLTIDREKLLQFVDERRIRKENSILAKLKSSVGFIYIYAHDTWVDGIENIITGVKEATSRLPFKKLNFVALYEQPPEKTTPLHRDAYIHVGDEKDMPPLPTYDEAVIWGFRSWLINDQLDNSFYIQKANHSALVTPEWPTPAIGSWWCFANSHPMFLHGSQRTEKGTRKIILISGGELDQQEHVSQLNRWVSKFEQQCLWQNDPKFYE